MLPEDCLVKIQVQEHAEGVEGQPREDEDDDHPDQEHHRLLLLAPPLLGNQTGLASEKRDGSPHENYRRRIMVN